MGKDIHVKVLEKNEGVRKEIKLYSKNDKGEFYPIDFYPFRNYELFDILDKSVPFSSIEMETLPEDLKKEIEDFDYGFNFKETTLADLKIYFYNHPKIESWDDGEDGEEEIDGKKLKDNPIKDFIERIENYCDIADSFVWNYLRIASKIRIIYWFDC